MNWAHRVVDEAGQMSHAEIYLIEYLAKSLPYKAVCVNIGTGPGTSILALLETRSDLICYAVDDHADMAMDRFKEAGVFDRVVYLTGDSQIMEWKHGKIDWLCIDGDHSYAGLSADIKNWIPHARGLVLFHDYNETMHAERWREVARAVDEWAGARKPIALADSLVVFSLKD